VAAETARVVVYGGLPAAALLALLGQPVTAVVVVFGWLLTAVMVRIFERYWSAREASRALLPAPLWIALPPLGSLLGTIRLCVQLALRVGVTVGLPVGTFAAIDTGNLWAIGGAALAWFLTLLYLSFAAVRNRVVVGDFDYVTIGATQPTAGNVDVADLLRGDLARFANLLQVVGDRRAVPSGVTEHSPLDATLSVDEFSDAFRGAAVDDAKLTWGKLSVPLAPLVRLLGRVVASARINGRLHQDGSTLILTAQTTGARRIAWRVEASRDGSGTSRRRAPIVGDPMADHRLGALTDPLSLTTATRAGGADATVGGAPAAPEAPPVAGMVRELALRIYTDLALDQSVRWEACEHFIDGLRAFRMCLRTPKDRKVNLRSAEGQMLEALAEDEDFPLAYYNLGVVYTELFGLAMAAGRAEEARMRRSAAETSFGRAIEKSPGRWDCHFAFAQTQLSYGRHSVVVELARFMLRRTRLTVAQEARTRELSARAAGLAVRQTAVRNDARGGNGGIGHEHGLEDPRLVRQAWREARRASELSLRALLLARMRRETLRSRNDDSSQQASHLASACLLTYGKCYLARERLRMGVDRGLGRGVRWRMKHLIRILSRFGDARAELQNYYGTFALEAGDLVKAEIQLREAADTVPTRPDYAADLSLCRARRLAARKAGQSVAAAEPITKAERDSVLSPALRALQGMAGTFFPGRDLAACESIAEVYTALSFLGPGPGPSDTGAQELRSESHVTWHSDVRTALVLREMSQRIRAALGRRSGAASISGVFLQAFHGEDQVDVGRLIGEFGTTARRAFELLVEGQRLRDTKPGHGAAEASANEQDARQLFEQALEQAERAVALNPLSTFAWETQGDIFAEFSDYENARDAWKQALRTDPDSPILYGKIGLSHWNIAQQGGARHEAGDLKHAARYFRAALLLYSNDDQKDRTVTHYRLSKLSSSLGQLAEARSHLRIVAAAAEKPPLLGWLMFGLACLRNEEFSEAEHYFRRTIRRGRALSEEVGEGGTPIGPDAIIGDRLDERLWPLALIRAWAHVGLVLSWADRDARGKDAEGELASAEALIRELYGAAFEDSADDERFPNRIAATIAEARGRLWLIRNDPKAAIDELEKAVSRYPFSRTYAALAVAIEQDASGRTPEDDLFLRVERLTEFAMTQGHSDELPAETRHLRKRILSREVVGAREPHESTEDGLSVATQRDVDEA